MQTIVRLIDRMAIFAHALVLPALFGFSDEVAGPLWRRLCRSLAAWLVGNSEDELRAFPRARAGFEGPM